MAAQSAPGGLYVGYYAEDPRTNPEDPTLGAFVMNLPTENTRFSGAMYFTYVGCQRENVGTVAGTKTNAGISGTWSGNIDGAMHSGTYTGGYDPVTHAYSGTYLHDGGKQFRDLRPCVQYYIAANGTWEMFPAETALPDNFQVAQSGRTISWPRVNGASIALVYLVNPQLVATKSNPVVWQTLTPATGSATIPANVVMHPGTPYVVSVVLTSGKYQRVAFGSKRFTNK